MTGAEVAIPAIISAAGSIGGGYLSSQGNGKETKIQKRQRHLIDDLIASLNGEGRYADLYNSNFEDFQKSFIDPAKHLWKNQIAPQIQQSFIANGQQRGSGLEGQLARAGVDLDMLLNQEYMKFQQQGNNNKINTINSILGGGAGAASSNSNAQNLAQATGGYLSSDAFSDAVTQGSKAFSNGGQNGPPTGSTAKPPGRKGFEQEWSDWGINDPRWGQ